MERRYRDRRKNGRNILTLWIVCLAACFFVPSAYAKYQTVYRAKPCAVTSDPFYFSVDLTGDSKMENGRFSEKEEKTYHLYGGSRHTITMELRNYYDSLRVTRKKIVYQVRLEASAGLASVKTADEEGLLSAVRGGSEEGEPLLQGTLGNEEGAACEPEEREMILELASCAEQNYLDGEEVILSIESTAPYKKTIELHFILHREEQALSYEIQDSPGNVYAELILKNHIPREEGITDGARPYIIWPMGLSVDQTNALTYQWDADRKVFSQQPIEEQGADRKMQISRPLEMNESCSLYFFKSDVTQDYTKETTVLRPDADGKLEILIPEANVGTEFSYGESLPMENPETVLPAQTAVGAYGRQYGGMDGGEQVKPAAPEESACTFAFTTQYMPGRYEKQQEVLQTRFHELRLRGGEDILVTAVKEGSADGQASLQSVIQGGVPQSLEGYELRQEEAEGNLAYFLQTPGNEEIPLEKEWQADGDFALPPGTTVLMIAKIQDYGPSYWYYYCTEEKGEISLSDFRQMGAAGECSMYSLSAALGSQGDIPAEGPVKEELRFILDFGNGETGMPEEQTVCAKLGHIATVGDAANVEIMYPSHPEVSDPGLLSGNTSESHSVKMELADGGRACSCRDTYELQLEITETPEVTDTRCLGREYAVKLELVEVDESGKLKTDEAGNVLTWPFPEGMTAVYGGQQVAASEGHRAFILPLKEAGTHRVTLHAGVGAFCGGEGGQVTLLASLYAVRDASYYREVDLKTRGIASFPVQAEPRYTLGVGAAQADGEGEQRRLLEKGEAFTLKVRAFEEGTSGTEDEVSVAVYQFDKENRSYTCLDWQEVFANEDGCLVKLSKGDALWKGLVSEEAGSGVYRLEFSYHDKTEYVDFIVN